MVNAPEEWPIEEYKDVDSTNYYHMVREMSNNDPAQLKTAMQALQHLARDHSRLPMQWSADANAGFSSPTSEKPWMRPHDNYTEINVQAQQNDPSSVLSFWKKMMRLRKEYSDSLVFGIFEMLDEQNPHVFSYLKQSKRGTMLVALNFSDTPQKLEQPSDLQGRDLKLLLSTAAGEASVSEELRPFEGRIYQVAALPN